MFKVLERSAPVRRLVYYVVTVVVAVIAFRGVPDLISAWVAVFK